MKNKSYIFTVCAWLMCTATISFAQMDSVVKASWILSHDTLLSQELRTKKAMKLVNKSINNIDAINNSYAWYTRGLITKEMYKVFEFQDKKSKARLDALEYFKIALSTDTSKGRQTIIKNKIEFNGNTYVITDIYHIANVKLGFRYLASTFFNDARDFLDKENYKTAVELFEKFKECILIGDPNYNLKEKEIEFNKALATVYTEIFQSNSKINSSYYGMTEDLYRRIIALDSNDNANYNMAMLHYNYAVNIINGLSDNMETVPLTDLDKIQEEAKQLFKKSLPYALKAYQLNPKRIEVLKCLEAIYKGLYEFDKADEFTAKITLLDKEK